jgi:hypothetical protein
MNQRPDFAVFSPDRQLQLVVEVKGTPVSDELWAAKFRRNLLSHGAVPTSPYFLLVLPDHLYFWSHPQQSVDALPDFSADTAAVLNRYLHTRINSISTPPLSERGLELAVGSWLSDLTSSENWLITDMPESEWLKTSGLSEKIRTGSIESEPAT